MAINPKASRPVRWASTGGGTQVEPPDAKKNAGFVIQKPEAAEYPNWLLARLARGVNLDRDEDALLRLPLISSLAFDRGFGTMTFARAGAATYIDRYGVLQNAVVDEPRFEIDGYLTEGPGENLAFRSQEFNNAYWTKNQCSINTDSTVGPDGLAGADSITENSAEATHSVSRVVAATDPTVANSLSVFVKAGTREQIFLKMEDNGAAGSVQALFDLGTGTILSETNVGTGTGATGKITELVVGAGGAAYFRVELSGIPATTGSTVTITYAPAIGGSTFYQGNGTDSIHVWGADLEELPFSTSYIQTVAAAVSRVRDDLTLTYQNNLHRPRESCTLFLDYDALGFDSSSMRLLQVMGETSREIFSGILGTSDLSVSWNTAQQLKTGISIPINTKQRGGFRFDRVTNDLSIWVDGDEKANVGLGSDAGGSATAIALGNNGAGAAEWYGHITNLRVYDRALLREEMATA